MRQNKRAEFLSYLFSFILGVLQRDVIVLDFFGYNVALNQNMTCKSFTGLLTVQSKLNINLTKLSYTYNYIHNWCLSQGIGMYFVIR